jgi:hypothetical protein
MSTDEKFKRSYNLVKNPTIYPQENREYLKEHFGVPAPASKTRSKTVPATKPKHHVLPTSLAPHPPLPTKNNFASTGDVKTVSESDLEHVRKSSYSNKIGSNGINRTWITTKANGHNAVH